MEAAIPANSTLGGDESPSKNYAMINSEKGSPSKSSERSSRVNGEMKPLGEPVIELEHLSKVYLIPGSTEEVVALKDISLATESEFPPVRQGEFLMIRGPSGGGKTTMLNLVGSIDTPSSGVIKLLGNVIDAKSTDEYLSRLRLERIGFVFQTFNLLATMSALENVELPMTLLGKLNEVERRERSKKLLSNVGLQDRMDHLPSELSGGEQQRVAIARALANEPDILLLDEPTGDLDTLNTVEVMNLLLHINVHGPQGDGRRRTTCVMVTHNPDLECYADRVVYVQDGVFIKQAINRRQEKLDYEDYLAYLNSQA
mmetsp:Transcript_30974/g.35286  ORF Transcript_30974/g.35286 Transcript_30974/m.35286 type:complete len:314 (-) Transcript_30974:231-1172(-)